MKELEKIANLLKKRRQIDERISSIIDRPALPGHIGEFIASKIFNIRLAASATAHGIDGVFCKGSLKDKTVNVKLYGKQEGVLDITLKDLADYYLVFAGPKSPAVSSKGESRPIVISHVYLFKMAELVSSLKKSGVKIGTATSVRKSYWEEAEIYPNQRNTTIKLTEDQRKALMLFSP